jgi:hypothetical protein
VDESKFELDRTGVTDGEWTVERPGIVTVLPCDRLGNLVDAATAADVPLTR